MALKEPNIHSGRFDLVFLDGHIVFCLVPFYQLTRCWPPSIVQARRYQLVAISRERDYSLALFTKMEHLINRYFNGRHESQLG